MYVHDLSIDSKTNYPLFVIICSLLRTVPLATLSIPSLVSDFSLNPSKMKMAALLKSLCFHPGKYQGVLGTWFPHATISHYFSNWHFSDWISGLWLAVVLLLWLSETVLDWMAPCGQLSIVMSPDVLCSLRKILFFCTAFFSVFVLQQTALILRFSWVKNIMCPASWRQSVLLILLFLIFSFAVSPLCLPLGHEFHFHWYSLGRPRFSCNNTESLQWP